MTAIEPTLFQQRLEALEAGQPLETCLDGLTANEVYLLQLAAVLRDLKATQAKKQPKRSRRRATTFHAKLSPQMQQKQVLPIWLKPLTKLEPDLQEVVALRFLDGRSVTEVAQSLNTPVNRILNLQHDGLQALRSALRQV